MNRSTGNLTLVALVAVGVGGLCWTILRAAPPLAGERANEAAPFGVLVLKTGNIVEGRLLKTGDDYEVQMSQSTMFVPGNFVKLQAESKIDAYDQLRKQLPETGGLSQRLALAKWCVTHQLISQARSELKTILEIDPDHDPAREQLRKIDEILSPPRSDAPDVAEKLKDSRLGLGPEAPALAGLPKEIGAEYVRRVQPILMNNCALAGCHGPQGGTSDFRLQRVSSSLRTVRGPSEKNLIEVLKHVQMERPRSSPLLAAPQEPQHGLRGKPVFVGARSDEQLETLRQWVVQVAKAQVALAESKSGKSRKKSEVVQVSAESDSTEPDAEASAPRVKDPFDPDTFNRQAP